MTIKEIIQGIKDGNRFALAKGLTIVESTRLTDREKATEIINACWNKNNMSKRIGITGSPGVGKSTFIDQFGIQLIEKGSKVAVLATDPSSSIHDGSILGDKTRMNQLSSHSSAFVRPSPNSNKIGGIQNRTFESIILCESAGYDTIIIETVGVGQSEFLVRDVVDCLVLLLLPNAGDELQGIKKGIMEVADLFILHKTDSVSPDQLQNAKNQLNNALHLAKEKSSKVKASIAEISSTEIAGISNFYNDLDNFFREIKINNYYNLNRSHQLKEYVRKLLQEKILNHYNSSIVNTEKWNEISLDSSPNQQAEKLFNHLINTK